MNRTNIALQLFWFPCFYFKVEKGWNINDTLKELPSKIITAVKWQLMGVPKEQYLIVILLIATLILGTYGIKRAGILEEVKVRTIQGIILLSGYLILVSFITLLRRTPGAQIHYVLIPFHNYFDPYGGVNQKVILYSFLNMLLFVPYGAIVAFLIKEKSSKFRIMLTGFFLSGLIEITQFVTRRGTFETEDLIFNTVGTYLGVLCYDWIVMLTYWYKERTKRRRNDLASKKEKEKNRDEIPN